MKKVKVIDTSGFIAGVKWTDACLVTVPAVVDELIDSTSRLKFDLLYDAGLRVEAPDPQYVELVISAATSTGDLSVLSKTDIDILAKALELKAGSSVLLITDDYAVQNVAASLEIEYLPAAVRGIQKIYSWELKCTGCGAIVASGGECPVCGSKVKRRKAGK